MSIDLEALVQASVANDHHESTAGWHFLNTYQNCRWRWYLKYIKGYEPQFTGKALLFGSAMHEVGEAFYLNPGMTRDEFTRLGSMLVASKKGQYEKDEDFEADLARMPIMAGAWYDKWALSDMENYDILEVEQEHVIDLPGGYKMTVRPDTVVRHKSTGLVNALERKTTASSVGGMTKSVSCQSQVDVQTIALTSKYGKDFAGVVPDIIYRRAQGPCQCERPPAVMRSARELAESKLNFAGLFKEITQKSLAIKDPSVPPELLFDRNGAWCAQFGCEYLGICRQRLNDKVPVGFHKREEA